MHPLASLLRPLGRALNARRSDPALRLEPWAGALDVPALTLTSPAFADGGEIPDRHCSMDLGPNLSPALRWSPVPPATVELLLVMEDPDAPFRIPAVHMAAVFPPTVMGWDEAGLAKGAAGVRFLPGRGGRTGYFGPRPFPGHGVHRYGFFLFALGAPVPAEAPGGLASLRPFLQKQTLARGSLHGIKRG